MADKENDDYSVLYKILQVVSGAFVGLLIFGLFLFFVGTPEAVPDDAVTPLYDFAARFNNLKDWQTLLAAVFGVIGLIIAHILTTTQQRRRDTEQRDAETKAIATALSVEINFLSQVAHNRVMEFQKRHPNIQTQPVILPNEAISAYRIPVATVYYTFAARLGILPPGALEQTVKFHLCLAEYDNTLSLGGIGNRNLTTLENACVSGKNAIAALNEIVGG